ncbi:DUF1837 domain-containing protein [Thalassospira australica]|uniref:HamA C-terminal domain-containing protein n=1 Tax=Thalassospira australica TaxID=1528106 RepID=UPI00384AB3DE
MTEWRCGGFAQNLIEWIIDYALKSDELVTLNHTNTYIRLRQAAARVYTSPKYSKRGEVGEIAAHAICRKYFGTIPVAPRVNYLSASNDPVKAFDLVHVRYLDDEQIEIWLGEAKFYQDRSSAIKAAISSILDHIDQGFLTNEKLLLAPQVSSEIPHYDKIQALLSAEESLDELIKQAVFPILIAADSDAVGKHEKVCKEYTEEVEDELNELFQAIKDSGLNLQITIKLIYVPLGSKEQLSTKFDSLLKGLQNGA